MLIEQVKREKEEMERSLLPLAAIKEKPEVAFEQFRVAVSNLRQIVAMGDRQQMQRLFDTPGRATDDERAIWSQFERR